MTEAEAVLEAVEAIEEEVDVEGVVEVPAPARREARRPSS